MTAEKEINLYLQSQTQRHEFHWPNFGAAVFEKLEEFWDHDVERSV